MSFLARSSIFCLVVTMMCFWEYTSAEAIQLLSFDKGENKFKINHTVLAIIKTLPSSMKVIAAIGDARVGKSTALNFIHHSFKENYRTRDVEKVFDTGDTMAGVTHGVWLLQSTMHSSLLFLDVEGADIGNDEVTSKVSIFTALMSSSLMLFIEKLPTNHVLEFLYKICRLSQIALDPKYTKQFPILTVVLRGALEPPTGYQTIDDYIKFCLLESDKQPGGKDNIIGKYFLKENIHVFKLPHISKPNNWNGIKKSSNTGYLDSILPLKNHLLKTPDKKSLNGASMDGKALAALAERLVDEMNNNKNWNSTLSSFYERFEKDNCDRGFEEYIKPLLDEKLSAADIEQKKGENMEQFIKHCIIGEEIGRAETKLEFALEAAKKRDSSSWAAYLATFGAGFAARQALLMGWAFSDNQLKQEISPVSGSEYESIGLHGVKWTWNDKAKKLGLSGKGEGVVAQEVERYYPWAVTEGPDGYKRVNYFLLKIMIKIKSFGSRYASAFDMLSRG